MRESEEYLDDNCTYTDSDCWVLHEDASDAVKLAYKEGRESMYKDIISKLKELEEINWYNTYKNIIANLKELENEDN